VLIAPKLLRFNKEGSLIQMTSGGKNYYPNTDERTIRKCIETYNASHEEKIVFTKQSLVSFGRSLFDKTLPFHKKSKMNWSVFENFKARGNRVQTFNQNHNYPKKTDTIAIDFNKCRTSIMRDQMLGEYKRYGIMDEIQLYKKRKRVLAQWLLLLSI
jgi:hypothetical protein